MKTLYQDIYYALRQLRKAPAFTITAVLTLALGIGANTAVFTLMHEVLLKSLPVAHPSGLYRVGDKYECCVQGGFQDDWTMFSYPLYEYLRDHTPEYEQLAASQTNRPDLSVRREGAKSAESFDGELVSGNYFSTLGLRAFAGRLNLPCRRSCRRAFCGGDELSRLAGEVRPGLFHGGRQPDDQRHSHDAGGDRTAGFLW